MVAAERMIVQTEPTERQILAVVVAEQEIHIREEQEDLVSLFSVM